MEDLESIGRALKRSGKADGIQKLAQSAEGQALGRMVDGQALQKAAQSADSQALRAMLGQVLNTDEGRRLAQQVRKLMEK